MERFIYFFIRHGVTTVAQKQIIKQTLKKKIGAKLIYVSSIGNLLQPIFEVSTRLVCDE